MTKHPQHIDSSETLTYIRHMKKLIILRGPSGSGKSTWAMNNYPNANICEADQYFMDSDGNYNFDPKQLGKAHLFCLGSATHIMLSGFTDVVVANTNLKYWEFENYMKVATALGYSIHIVTLKTQFQNTHGLPQNTVDKMRFKMDTIASIIDKCAENGYKVTTEVVR